MKRSKWLVALVPLSKGIKLQQEGKGRSRFHSEKGFSYLWCCNQNKLWVWTMCSKQQLLTWHFSGFLVFSIRVWGTTCIFAKLGSIDTRNGQSMSVSALIHQIVGTIKRGSILVPCQFGSGWRVNDTNDFCLVTLASMNECFFLFDLGFVCN